MPNPIRRGRMGLFGSAVSLPPLVFLLRDEFVTPTMAPISSPHTAEPGPGTEVIVDTLSNMSIANGFLTISGWNAVGDPGAWGGAQTPAKGLAYYIKLRTDPSNASYMTAGWDTNQSGALQTKIRLRSNNQDIYIYDAGTDLALAISGFNRTLFHEFIFICRNPGVYIFARANGSSDWRLVFTSPNMNSNPIYPAITMDYYISGSFYADGMRILQLGAPWSAAFGIATGYTASPSTGATLAHSADCIAEFNWTCKTGETLEFDIRRTDADNRWIVRCSQSGSTIKLIERNGGTETERSSASKSFYNNNVYQITVWAYGSTIKTYMGSGAGLQNSYASATFNQTATLAEVSGFTVGSDFATFPAILPAGAAKSALDRIGALS